MSKAGWSETWPEAERSNASCSGTFGGADAFCKKARAHTLLNSSVPSSTAFWRSGCAGLAGFGCSAKGGTVPVFGSYNRGGVNETILEAVAAETHGGKLPFVLFGGCNAGRADPSLMEWCGVLGAQVMAAGAGRVIEPTCSPSRGSRVAPTSC